MGASELIRIERGTAVRKQEWSRNQYDDDCRPDNPGAGIPNTSLLHPAIITKQPKRQTRKLSSRGASQEDRIQELLKAKIEIKDLSCQPPAPIAGLLTATSTLWDLHSIPASCNSSIGGLECGFAAF
jgi:hypothetical protein